MGAEKGKERRRAPKEGFVPIAIQRGLVDNPAINPFALRVWLVIRGMQYACGRSAVAVSIQALCKKTGIKRDAVIGAVKFLMATKPPLLTKSRRGNNMMGLCNMYSALTPPKSWYDCNADSVGQTDSIDGQECADSVGQTDSIDGQECADSVGQTDRVVGQTDRVVGQTDRVVGQTDRLVGQTDSLTKTNTKTNKEDQTQPARAREGVGVGGFSDSISVGLGDGGYPGSPEKVLAIASGKGISCSIEDAGQFFATFAPAWRAKDGRPIRDWLAVFRSWMKSKRANEEGARIDDEYGRKIEEDRRRAEERMARREADAASPKCFAIVGDILSGIANSSTATGLRIDGDAAVCAEPPKVSKVETEEDRQARIEERRRAIQAFCNGGNPLAPDVVCLSAGGEDVHVEKQGQGRSDGNADDGAPKETSVTKEQQEAIGRIRLEIERLDGAAFANRSADDVIRRLAWKQVKAIARFIHSGDEYEARERTYDAVSLVWNAFNGGEA